MLRNPSDRPASFAVDVQEVLELPAEQPQAWRGRSPWREDRARAAVDFEAGTPRIIELRPFEVLTLDLVPQPAAARQ